VTELKTVSAYGALIEPATLKIERLLPGPAERVWGYLTQSELRRQWLASGDMQMKVDAPVELVWRNDELTDPPGRRPDGFAQEHRMVSRIIAFDPHRKLTISWGEKGEVTFLLEPQGEQVLLTVIHRRVPDRSMLLKVSAGWHAHLDILVSVMRGERKAPFWDGWTKLHQDYDGRMPA
jgi:uncharacterized protein YndB with AHSA1/START domain